MSPTRAAAQRTALLRAGYRAGRKERAAPIDWRNRPNQRSRQSPSIARFLGEKYPRAAELLCERAQRYNEGVALAQKYAGQGRVLIIAPDDTCGVDTLKRNRASLQRLYEKGYADGRKITDFLGKG